MVSDPFFTFSVKGVAPERAGALLRALASRSFALLAASVAPTWIIVPELAAAGRAGSALATRVACFSGARAWAAGAATLDAPPGVTGLAAAWRVEPSETFAAGIEAVRSSGARVPLAITAGLGLSASAAMVGAGAGGA